MLAERFTVIANDDHERVVAGAAVVQPGEKPGDLQIGLGDLRVVRS
jgi:hypothetical protein